MKYISFLFLMLSLQSCAYYFGNDPVRRSVPTEDFTNTMDKLFFQIIKIKMSSAMNYSQNSKIIK